MTDARQILSALATGFSRIAASRRELEDDCVHSVDRDRARMRSLICMDIADALQIAVAQSGPETSTRKEGEANATGTLSGTSPAAPSQSDPSMDAATALQAIADNVPRFTLSFPCPKGVVGWTEHYDIWLHDFISLVLSVQSGPSDTAQWKTVACLFHDALVGHGMGGMFNQKLALQAMALFDAAIQQDGTAQKDR